MAADEALGDDEGDAAGAEHAADLLRRARDVPLRPEVLDRREREDDVEAPVRELELARVHPPGLEPLLAVG